jgi:hypothetical protein
MLLTKVILFAAVLGVPALANSVTLMITESEIAAAAGSITYCTAAFTGCGIYGIGIDNTAAGSFTLSGVTGTLQGVVAPVASWGQVTLHDSPNAYGVGALTTNTNAAMMTEHSGTLTGSWGGDFDNAGQPGNTFTSATSFYTAGTALGFIFNAGATNIAYGSTATVLLDVLSDDISGNSQPSTGATAKGAVSFVSFVVTAVPEPSSMPLLFGGVACIVFGRFRRSQA